MKTAYQWGGPLTIESEKQIDQSDLFVFILSPGSVSSGSYTLTELSLC